MKIPESPLLPLDTPAALKIALTKTLSAIAVKLNQLASGVLAGHDDVYVAVPTVGTWVHGDYVKKGSPVEAGGVGAKYVIMGWIRLTSGSANVLNTDWVEDRRLTGN